MIETPGEMFARRILEQQLSPIVRKRPEETRFDRRARVIETVRRIQEVADRSRRS